MTTTGVGAVPTAVVAVPIPICKATIPVGKATVAVGKATTPADKAIVAVGKATTPVDKTPVAVAETPAPVGKAPTPVDEATVAVDKAPTPVDKATTTVGKTTVAVDRVTTTVDEAQATVAERTTAAGDDTTRVGQLPTRRRETIQPIRPYDHQVMSWEEDFNRRVAAFPEDVRNAHLHSSDHRNEILASSQCGCFYCCQVFPPSAIVDWADPDEQGERQTAICPRCGIDSVIGDQSGFPIDAGFLGKMKAHWF